MRRNNIAIIEKKAETIATITSAVCFVLLTVAVIFNTIKTTSCFNGSSLMRLLIYIALVYEGSVLLYHLTKKCWIDHLKNA